MKRISSLILSLSLCRPEAVVFPLWAAEAAPKTDRAALEGVEVGEDSVKLRLSAPAKFNPFVTKNPPRLVLELLNTNFNMGSKVAEGKGGILKKIRSGQYQGEPNPITRVVMDLGQAAKYEIQPSGNDILVRLKGSAASLPAAPGSGKSPGTAGSENGSPAAAKPVLLASAAPMPPAPVPAAAAPKPAVTELSELGAMAAQATVAPKTAIADAPAPRAAPEPKAAKPRRDILGTLPKEVLPTLDHEGEVGDLLKLMAAKAGISLIYGSDVSGTISVHLSDIPYNEAFNIILSMQGLAATQVGDNILRVSTPKQLEKERKDVVGTTRIFPLNYIRAAEAKTTIDLVRAAEKRSGTTVPDGLNNALIVTDTSEGLAAVERLLGQIDIRPKQVIIETKLVEVTLTKDVHLGIQWDYLSNLPSGAVGGQRAINVIGSAANPMNSTLNPVAGGLPIRTISPFDSGTVNSVGAAGRGTGVSLPADKVFGAFTFGRITNNYFLTATLTAAAAQGKVKVLSDPKIATINGKTATINITTSIPYVTSNVSSTGVATQTVAYTITGIQLSVTPNIAPDGRINLLVSPRISKPSATASAAGTTGAVAVDTRDATTNVVVRDGETIVIGGLITDSISNQEGKIPLLGDIPILGWLFKKKSIVRSRVELLIFVTTRVLPE